MHSNSPDELIRFLNNYSAQETRIELIQGHAASSEANAEELSLRRAQAVRDYMINHNIAAGKLTDTVRIESWVQTVLWMQAMRTILIITLIRVWSCKFLDEFPLRHST